MKPDISVTAGVSRTAGGARAKSGLRAERLDEWSSPEFLPGRTTFVLGVDGNHMGSLTTT